MATKTTTLILLGFCTVGLAARGRPKIRSRGETPAANGVDWTYEGELNWGAAFPDCDGNNQSPININTNRAKKTRITPLKFHNNNVLPKLQTITNDGHSLKVELTEVARTPFIIGAGPEPRDRYNFAQYHFHFGTTNRQGSEHTVNTVRYPIELHMVHVNAKYSSFIDAISHADGLAVLGVLFIVSKNDNPALTPLIDAIPEIWDFHSEVHFVQKTNLYALSSLLPANTKRLYRYQGSLTTPTCNEVVTWTLFDKHIKISEKQLEVFRTMLNKHGEKTADNYRPTQALNKRKVFKTFR